MKNVLGNMLLDFLILAFFVGATLIIAEWDKGFWRTAGITLMFVTYTTIHCNINAKRMQ